MTFTDHIEATRRAAELVAEGVTAKYVGLWDGLYIVEYQANERLPERTMPVTPEPAPVEMQYINRRDFMPDGVTRGDGALWPTMFPITSPGWVQIGAYPIAGRHEVGDTVLFFDRYPVNAKAMFRAGRVLSIDSDGWMHTDAVCANEDRFINFSKGDHLSESEREAWEAEAAYDNDIKSEYAYK